MSKTETRGELATATVEELHKSGIDLAVAGELVRASAVVVEIRTRIDATVERRAGDDRIPSSEIVTPELVEAEELANEIAGVIRRVRNERIERSTR